MRPCFPLFLLKILSHLSTNVPENVAASIPASHFLIFFTLFLLHGNIAAMLMVMATLLVHACTFIYYHVNVNHSQFLQPAFQAFHVWVMWPLIFPFSFCFWFWLQLIQAFVYLTCRTRPIELVFEIDSNNSEEQFLVSIGVSMRRCSYRAFSILCLRLSSNFLIQLSFEAFSLPTTKLLRGYIWFVWYIALSSVRTRGLHYRN